MPSLSHTPTPAYITAHPKSSARPNLLNESKSPLIDGLVSGRLVGLAEKREGKNASEFVLAKVRAIAGDGEPILVNVIAFAAEACAALVALDDGDSVALSGSLTPKVWIDKRGNSKPTLDMVVANVMTIYQLDDKQSDSSPQGQ